MASVFSVPITAGTTSTSTELPMNSIALLLRCPSTNTDNVYVNIGGNFAGTGDIIIRPNESINVGNELWLIFKAQLGIPVNANDYYKKIVVYSPTASQTLYVDAETWNGV